MSNQKSYMKMKWVVDQQKSSPSEEKCQKFLQAPLDAGWFNSCAYARKFHPYSYTMAPSASKISLDTVKSINMWRSLVSYIHLQYSHMRLSSATLSSRKLSSATERVKIKYSLIQLLLDLINIPKMQLCSIISHYFKCKDNLDKKYIYSDIQRTLASVNLNAIQGLDCRNIYWRLHRKRTDDTDNSKSWTHYKQPINIFLILKSLAYSTVSDCIGWYRRNGYGVEWCCAKAKMKK